jgi:hypothetical protein
MRAMLHAFARAYWATFARGGARLTHAHFFAVRPEQRLLFVDTHRWDAE